MLSFGDTSQDLRRKDRAERLLMDEVDDICVLAIAPSSLSRIGWAFD
jgi:hypothetical protein